MEMEMAVNKTLYVRDEDAPIWDYAKELVGESLSSYLTNHLRQLVDERKNQQIGYERILLTFREDGLPRTVSFFGRWLVTPDEPFESERVIHHFSEIDVEPRYYAVALTAKGRVAVFEYRSASQDGTYLDARLRSFNSFELASQGVGIPTDAVAQAMEAQGIPVEELDI